MQHKKHIITITGKPASGKSTAAKSAAKQLGYEHYSTGDLMREIAAEHNTDLLQINFYAEGDSSLDHRVDERQKKLGETKDEFVIDARLGWLFIPESFKIYLDLDTLDGARRILETRELRKDANEHIPDDPLEYADILDQRLASESKRYMALYGADAHDLSNFDLVIDTKVNTPERVVELILQGYKKWIDA